MEMSLQKRMNFLNELGEVNKKPMQERIHELIPSFTLAF